VRLERLRGDGLAILDGDWCSLPPSDLFCLLVSLIHLAAYAAGLHGNAQSAVSRLCRNLFSEDAEPTNSLPASFYLRGARVLPAVVRRCGQQSFERRQVSVHLEVQTSPDEPTPTF